MSAALPDFTPKSWWTLAPNGWVSRQWGGVFPPVVRLSNGDLVVDECVDYKHTSSIQTIKIKVLSKGDHPNLAKLSSNAPRAVKTLYRADTQLRIIRSTCYMKIALMLAQARMAFAIYHKFDPEPNDLDTIKRLTR